LLQLSLRSIKGIQGWFSYLLYNLIIRKILSHSSTWIAQVVPVSSIGKGVFIARHHVNN
jgi:hypothetical protein